LLFGQRVPVQHILAVTFTNKAANEMKERLVDLTREMAHLSDQTNNRPIVTHTHSQGNAEKIQDDNNINDFLSHIQQTQLTHNNAPHFSLHDFKWIGTFHSIFLKILKEDIEAL
jgi:superfamily I DNA/RNA helicase